MRGVESRDEWETAGRYTADEVRKFLLALPVRPIWNDPLTNPHPGDAGATPGLRVCASPTGDKEVIRVR